MASMILQSERLILRPIQRGDEGDLFLYQSDPETVRFIPWPARTRDQVLEAVDKAVAAKSFEKDGDFALFVWVLKETGQVIGQSNIRIESTEHKRGEIGWVANPLFTRRGLASEAIRLVFDFAFGSCDFNKIVAYIDTRNGKSIGLATKLGMRREAEYREDEFCKGEWIDAYLYAILKREWEISGQSKAII